MDLHAYLTFNGNCREAMTFYQDCLGGELCFQPLEESLLAPGLPACSITWCMPLQAGMAWC